MLLVHQIRGTPNRATNTGENIRHCKALIQDLEMAPKSFILVQKPFMQRRVYATFRLYYPEVSVVISSPCCVYEDYVGAMCSESNLINLMVGDLQRIIEYPKMGFQIYQEVPSDVIDAYFVLIKNGFTKHMLSI